MGKPVLTKNKRYKKGIFTPKNLHKYVGDPTKIIYRSGWEKHFLEWCDRNPNVIQYNSEEVVIPYMSPIDRKQHRYFCDFCVAIRQPNGVIGKYLVEIKPYAQTKPPKRTGKMLLETFNNNYKTYIINQAKWNTAKVFAKQRNMEFIVLTEKELFKDKPKPKRKKK